MEMLQSKPPQSQYTVMPLEHNSRDMVTTTRDSQQPEKLLKHVQKRITK